MFTFNFAFSEYLKGLNTYLNTTAFSSKWDSNINSFLSKLLINFQAAIWATINKQKHI